jgi:hypothetical protein
MLLPIMALAGCAGGAGVCPCDVPDVRASQQPGTTVMLRDKLSFPFRLAKLMVALDGELLHQQVFDADRLSRPSTLAQRELPEGVHTLSVKAVVSYASTELDADDGCNVELRTSETFSVQPGSSTVRLDIYAAGDVTKRFADRPTMSIRMRGAAYAGGGEIDYTHTLERRSGELAASCRDDGPLVADELPYPFDDRYRTSVLPLR